MILLFISILVLIIITIIKTFAEFMLKDLDFLDVGYSLCIYLSVFTLKYFNFIYGNDAVIDRFMDLFIKIGWLTHVLIPMALLAITMFLKKIKEANKDA